MPRSARVVLTAMLLVAAVSGCAGRVNKVMQSWQGANYADLIMSWGPPQRIYDDGNGGRILVYTSSRSWTTPGQSVTSTSVQAQAYGNTIWGQAQSITQYVPPQTQGYTAWRMFRVDRSGRIYNWSWKGL